MMVGMRRSGGRGKNKEMGFERRVGHTRQDYLKAWLAAGCRDAGGGREDKSVNWRKSAHGCQKGCITQRKRKTNPGGDYRPNALTLSPFKTEGWGGKSLG